jgi:hypothetical protein
MKPFYHLNHLGDTMVRLLYCNIEKVDRDRFDPLDKLMFAFAIAEPDTIDLIPESFLEYYVAPAIRDMVTYCNKMKSIEVGELPIDTTKEQQIFEYMPIPVRFTIERLSKDADGNPWSGFFFILDTLVRKV